MATYIEYGGGPSAEVRMEAIKPKYGAQLVGYTGCIPGMKYTQGANSSILSHCLAKNIHRHKHPAIGFAPQKVAKGPNHPSVQREKNELQLELSKGCKEQKYLIDLLPGYSGYIPRLTYNSLSLTYTKGTFKALKDHSKIKNKHKKLIDEMRDDQKCERSLQPIECDEEITRFLNNRHNDIFPCGYPGHRGPLEPPIVGYMGHTPRTKVLIETSGMNHQRESCFGLVTFDCMRKYNDERLRKPCVDPYSPIHPYLCLEPPPVHRIFMQDGMIPRYKGVVHENLFTFGKTYGAATRDLEVCCHDDVNFGAHQKKKELKNLRDRVFVTS